MRKYISLRISFILLVGLLSSCEKVIELQLDTSASQIVIQGNVYDQHGPYTVIISKSINFDEESINGYPAVTNATVIICDNIGNTDTLTGSSSGIYVTSTLQGVPGRTYTLTVQIEGQTYTASSTMPNAVEIDSVYFKKSLFGNEKQITLDFTDPTNTKNYYRLIEFVNNTPLEGFNVTDDKLYEGKIVSYTFMSMGNDSNKRIVAGDRISIWLETIDKGAYEYFRTASRDGGQSASPANPTSNINNGALGYFNAYAVRTVSIIVP
jgi:hypothetical protein